jgi:nucleoside-diphosphate-sugar epimerase
MRWIRGLVNGTIPVIDIGGSFIDVRDSAEAHVRAISLGQVGERYVVSGAHLRMVEIADIIRRQTGTRHLKLKLPKRLALLAAGFLEVVAHISNRQPLTTRAFIREQLGRYLYADPTLADKTFGFTPRGGEAMIVDAIRWLLYLGVIHRRKARQLAVHFPPDVEWGPRSESA